MRIGTRVEHVSRPDLGVGTVRAEIKGEPQVREVVWEALAPSGRRKWGHYLVTQLVEVAS